MNDDAWKRYAADFRNMTDDEIEFSSEHSRYQIEKHEDWLEAVTSWEAAGKPRDLGARAMTDDLVKRLRDDSETLADLIEAASQAADRIDELEAAIREMTGV